MNKQLLYKLKIVGINKTIVNGSFFALFSFINKGIAFLLLLVLANYLLPSDYGYLSLFTTVMSLMSFILALSTEGYLGVTYFKDGLEGVKNCISAVLAISSVSFFVFILIIIYWGSQLEEMLDIPLQSIILAVTICFFTIIFNMLLDYERLEENICKYGIMSCSNALLNLFLSIIMVKTLMMGWQGRVWAQLACYSMFGIIGLIFFIKKGYLVKPQWNYIKVMVLWGVPLIPHLATSFVRQGCDRYIINFFYSIEDVGLFSFGLTIASIITMLGNGFNQSNSVEIYKTLSNTSLVRSEKIMVLKRQRLLYWKIYACFLITIVFLGYPYTLL